MCRRFRVPPTRGIDQSAGLMPGDSPHCGAFACRVRALRSRNQCRARKAVLAAIPTARCLPAGVTVRRCPSATSRSPSNPDSIETSMEPRPTCSQRSRWMPMPKISCWERSRRCRAWSFSAAAAAGGETAWPALSAVRGGLRPLAAALFPQPATGAEASLHHPDGDVQHHRHHRLSLRHHPQGLFPATGHRHDHSDRRGSTGRLVHRDERTPGSSRPRGAEGSCGCLGRLTDRRDRRRHAE